MALRWADGFDTGSANVVGRYQGTFTNSTTAGRFRTGIRSLELLSSYAAKTAPLGISGDTVIVGGWVFVSALFATTFFEIYEGTTLHASVGLDATGHVVVKRSTTVLQTGTTALSALNGYYLEFKVKIADGASGTYEVRIDGAIFDSMSSAGTDTRNGGTGVADAVRFGPGGVGSTYFDDVYVCDGSGAKNNDFLATTTTLPRVYGKLPSTDAVAAGTHSDLTPSTGADNGAMVDENSPDSETTYNAGDTPGEKDSYNYPALASGGVVVGVVVNTWCRKTDAGARSARPLIRSGGTDYFGAPFSLLTTYTYFSEVFENDPNGTIDWTEAAVDAAEFGFDIVS